MLKRELASDLHRCLDPVQIARDAGYEPDEWQAKLLRDRPRRALLLTARQAGKSSCCAWLVIRQALFDPGLILVLSASQRQAVELHRTIIQVYNRLPGAPPLTEESTLRTTFATGARLIALPGSEASARGYASVKMVVVDEAARVSDELLAAVRPTMSAVADSTFIALSTPAGERGWFWNAFVNGDDAWTRVRITADQCPRLSPEFLKEEERELGPMLFRQEYQCEFISDLESVFPGHLIEAAFDNDLRALW